MTAKMIWTRSGEDEWVGNYGGCQHYQLLRQDRGKVWVVRRAGTEIGRYSKRGDASIAALEDEWRVRKAANDRYDEEGKARARERRDERWGPPFEVIEHPMRHGPTYLELRARFVPAVMPSESWLASVYRPEWYYVYGDTGSIVYSESFATEQLAKMGAQAGAETHVRQQRDLSADIERRLAEPTP